MKNQMPKMTIHMATLIYLGLVLFAFYGCSPKQVEGPGLNQLYGPFKITSPGLTISNRKPDFANGAKVTFSLGLSVISSWTITITGLGSGAKKVISGWSSTLDATNAVWDGSTTYFPLFRKEKCAIQVGFAGQATILYDTITIASQKPLPTGTPVVIFNNSNFSVLYPTYIDYSGNGNVWTIDSSYSPNIGKFALGGKGFDRLKQTYTGSITYVCKLFYPGDTTYKISTNNPSDVYFNVAIYGSGIQGSQVNFQFAEDCNNDGIYTSSLDNLYQQITVINWTGWKLVSFKYSSAALLTQGNVAKPQNPQKILQVGFLQFATSGDSTRWALDYPVFTVNTPFNP